MSHRPWRPAVRRIAGAWPWLIVALAVLPAVYRILDYPSEIDPEYPRVFRPVFNRLPPLAYRLAEPGDRLDQASVWLAAGAIALAVRGWLSARREGRSTGPWPAAAAMAIAVFWIAAIPWPTPDGWHGLGWPSIADPATPAFQRLLLIGVAAGLAGVVAGSIRRSGLARLTRGADAPLLAVALGLIGLGLAGLPRLEPAGYWPRWAVIWGLLAWDLGLFRAIDRRRDGAGRRWLGAASWATAWAALVAAGLAIAWYHRPIDRFKEVVPGKIYISAMPGELSLGLIHSRHHFKTIINLFPEDGPWRSPYLDEEMAFAREHGIRYVANPGEGPDPSAFIERTLDVARDPAAWPILVHCHACYDRTPAWVGIYRFVEQGLPLDGILREIERHRGSRPKASVTLLYNRVLPALSPSHYAEDPTATLLRQFAADETLTTMAGPRRDPVPNPPKGPRRSRNGLAYDSLSSSW